MRTSLPRVTALVVLAASATSVIGSIFGGSAPQTNAEALEKGWEYVTTGSTIKLAHVKTDTRLTMPQVSYGTGSQQQAVTAQGDASLTKALWRVEPLDAEERGAPVACGSRLQLINSDSDHRLHSHAAHRSPLSGNQEVSAFDGRDDGDVWTLECLKAEKLWRRETPVYLRHVDTGKYLASIPSKKYRQPISGHQEVSAGKKPDANAQWMALEGYYFSRRSPVPQ
ncbi:hypothetical protein H4R20_005886 [Coemansia guatemalensis]|uniref:MIR domain-containing protein n=1 Tax=Coemansia guatemalensis TaxID=2761395 RepID=A0A9W8LRP3_9FUNG|nr:hypothetical protein H4R20_005886 [Coemansia guatemalensis]